VQIATFALAKPRLMHMPLRIFQKDVFTLSYCKIISSTFVRNKSIMLTNERLSEKINLLLPLLIVTCAIESDCSKPTNI